MSRLAYIRGGIVAAVGDVDAAWAASFVTPPDLVVAAPLSVEVGQGWDGAQFTPLDAAAIDAVRADDDAMNEVWAIQTEWALHAIDPDATLAALAALRSQVVTVRDADPPTVTSIATAQTAVNQLTAGLNILAAALIELSKYVLRDDSEA